MKIALLIGNIATLATLIRLHSKIDVFFEYNSSAEVLHVRVFKKGWLVNQEPDEWHQLWLDEGEAKSIEKLETLKDHLMSIYQSIKKEVA